jgi:hypothetical protein
VGEILAYQSYNTKSPLNGRAAQWVDEHRDQLPIDREEFFRDLAVDTVAPAVTACANCGAPARATCAAAHPCARTARSRARVAPRSCAWCATPSRAGAARRDVT